MRVCMCQFRLRMYGMRRLSGVCMLLSFGEFASRGTGGPR